MNLELRILAKWLENKESDLFDVNEGVVEGKIRNMKQEMFQELGSMITEISEMNFSNKLKEIQNDKK